MKLIFIFLVLALEMNPVQPPYPLELVHVEVTSQSDPWQKSLARFRAALLSGDRATVKSFFDFPILNPGNEIWFAASQEYLSKMDDKTIVPFKELDFDMHYSDILPIDFRKTFEGIDLAKLSKNMITESKPLTIVSPATSQMIAKYSEQKQMITLSVITKSSEFGQYSIDYHFKVLPGGDVKFSHVRFNI